MAFFQSAISGIQTFVVVLGAGFAAWGGINLMEGYGHDNAAAKSQGIKQVIAGGGVMFIGVTLIPMLATMF